MSRVLVILAFVLAYLLAVPAHGAVTKPVDDVSVASAINLSTPLLSSEDEPSLSRRSPDSILDQIRHYVHKHWGQMEIGDYDVTRVGGVTPTLIGTGGNAPPNPAKVTGYSAQFHIILGQGVDNRIAYHKVAGDDLSFYMTNHQGSTVAMTDDSGELLPVRLHIK